MKKFAHERTATCFWVFILAGNTSATDLKVTFETKDVAESWNNHEYGSTMRMSNTSLVSMFTILVAVAHSIHL